MGRKKGGDNQRDPEVKEEQEGGKRGDEGRKLIKRRNKLNPHALN